MRSRTVSPDVVDFRLTTPMGLYNNVVGLMLLLELALAVVLLAVYFGVGPF